MGWLPASCVHVGLAKAALSTGRSTPLLWKVTSSALSTPSYFPSFPSSVSSSFALYSAIGSPGDQSNDMAFDEGSPPNLFLKNVTVYWVGATALCLWFLFVHAPPFIVERKVYQDMPLATHMGGAYVIYLACLVNSLFTPSTLKNGKQVHTTIGKIGMISGFVSFALGFYCAWLRPVTPPLGFSIGITVGGVAQITSQFFGWRSIRNYQQYSLQEAEIVAQGDSARNSDRFLELQDKKRASLTTHIYNMIALYTVACGAPALLRITGMVLPEGMGVPGLVGSVVFLNVMAKPFGDTYLHKSKSK